MRRFFLLLLPLIIILSGCGLAQKAADKAAEKALEKATGVSVDEKNNSVTIKGQDGQSVTVQSTEAKLPDGFPLKVHSGGKVTSGSVMKSNGKQVFTVEIAFDKDPTAVADYYEKAMTDLGLKIDRMDSESNGEVTIMLSGESDKLSTWTTVNWTEQDKGKVALMIGDK
jgi:hypothetical protein